MSPGRLRFPTVEDFGGAEPQKGSPASREVGRLPVRWRLWGAGRAAHVRGNSNESGTRQGTREEGPDTGPSREGPETLEGTKPKRGPAGS
jgi:hypothetical protein